MANNYNINQFQFFTFITGLQNKEQELIKKLIKYFPYKDTHKINIIDKTEALRRKFINKEKIFHSERVYIVKDNMDFDFDLWKEFIKSNQKYINIIKEKTFDVHIKSVHKIMTEYLNADFAVILDSDTKFINADDSLNISQEDFEMPETMIKSPIRCDHIINELEEDEELEDNW